MKLCHWRNGNSAETYMNEQESTNFTVKLQQQKQTCAELAKQSINNMMRNVHHSSNDLCLRQHVTVPHIASSDRLVKSTLQSSTACVCVCVCERENVLTRQPSDRFGCSVCLQGVDDGACVNSFAWFTCESTRARSCEFRKGVHLSHFGIAVLCPWKIILL